MEYSIFTIRLAEMLLTPIDSQILAKIYEKAPKKKLAVVAKIINDRMRKKIINNLLDNWNVNYTISQIINGKIDHFYGTSAFNVEIDNFPYSKLRELLQHHDPQAGSVLLTLLKNSSNSTIEIYFDKVVNIENLYEAWGEINWSVNDEKSKSQDNPVERHLNSEIIRLTKANSKLKKKFNQGKLQHNNEINQITDKFKQQLTERTELEITERKHEIKEIKKEYSDANEQASKQYRKEIDRLHIEMDKIEQKLFQKSRVADTYSSMLKMIGTAHIENITLVAGEKCSKSLNNGYIYIGTSNTVDQLVEWVRFMRPSRLILLQEVTARYLWLSLMTKIREEKLATSVVFLSQYELVNGGTDDDRNN